MSKKKFKKSLLEDAYWKKSGSGYHVVVGWDNEADPRCEQVSVCLWDDGPSQANNGALCSLKDDFVGNVGIEKLAPMVWEDSSIEEGVCQLSLILNSDHRPEVAPESTQREEGRKRIANVVERIEEAFDQTVADRVKRPSPQSGAPPKSVAERVRDGREQDSSPVR